MFFKIIKVLCSLILGVFGMAIFSVLMFKNNIDLTKNVYSPFLANGIFLLVTGLSMYVLGVFRRK